MSGTFNRILSDGFRVFFLVAALHAVLAVTVWELWLGVHAAGGMMSDLPFATAPHLWHAHEMIFGYATATISGFLLTAVPNWTGGRAPGRSFIALAATVWLAGRLAVWFSGALPPLLVAGADLSALPLLMGYLALQLINKPKPQNVVFIGFLGLLWAGNLLVHLDWTGLTNDTGGTGMRIGLLTLCAMIGLLGGRVTPAFTRNAMQRAGLAENHWPKPRAWADRPAVLLTSFLPLAVLFPTPDKPLAVVAVLAGVLQILRVGFWRPGWTLRQPILWSLHLGVAMLGAGLILWGASLLGLGSEVAALHVLGIGAVGGMTLAVMSRAILGHSGRPLAAPGPVALAYGLIALAACTRWLGSALAGTLYFPMVLISGGLWMLGFTLFIVALWPAIAQPRETEG